MKMTMSTTATMSARVHRKVIHKRPHPGKSGLPGKMLHAGKMAHPGKSAHNPGKFAHLGKLGKLSHYAHTHSLRPPEPCENSNDSGLGPDPVNRCADTTEEWDHGEAKRRRADDHPVKVECDDAIDAYTFAPALAPAPAPAPLDTSSAPLPAPVIRAGCSLSSPNISESPGKRFQEPAYRACGGKLGSSAKLAGKYAGGGKLVGVGGKLSGKLGGKYGGKLAQALARRRALAAMAHSGPPGLAAPLSSRSRDGSVELQILCQPETQHRARYQTEGSRGAVKDNSGNGFPIVKLVGYDKPAVLQVFIGTDSGRVAPHMFYQACRVAGKNSTPCRERKEDGTVLIELDLDPSKNWQVTCDCVGILKERNVDVEHRFGEALGGGAGGAGGGHSARGKKKSTRCRMVFRTDIVDANGRTETLQVCSTQIICTQPPGVPEVCRKSLVSCPATGGLELYLLGKNFLKETRVVFCQRQDGHTTWEEEVVPDKEFLQQTHLVCCVPPYLRTDISEPVTVQLFVRSGGRASEPHTFRYTPPGAAPLHCTLHHTQGAASGAPCAGGAAEEPRPVLAWGGAPGMMPPPALPVRRPSLILPDPHSPLGLKSEVPDETSQHSAPEEGSCGAEGPESLRPAHGTHSAHTAPLAGIDLRLKTEAARDSANQVGFVGAYESMKLSPGTPTPSQPPSPLATFTQQLQAIQNQVQTDKMVESVTAAIFNSDGGGQIYVDQPMMPMASMDPMRQLMAAKGSMDPLETNMKVLGPELMMRDSSLQASVMQPTTEQRMIVYNQMQTDRTEETFNPFGVLTKMELGSSQIERRLAQQSAHMEALVEDAMKATAAILPADAAKLDELVNSRVDDHLSGTNSPSSASHASDVLLSPNAAVVSRAQGADLLQPMSQSAISPDVILNPQVSPSLLCDNNQRMVLPAGGAQDDLMMIPDIPTSVKTPPAAVKSMILNAAAEILTSDTTMNALVTSAINTANILSTESAAGGGGLPAGAADTQPPAEPAAETPLEAMSQAVSQAVTQAVSQAVSHAVSQAVSQEMSGPVQGLTDMSDQDLLSYINPSTFDQV
ncbi:nuclear factor of activated T-cells 5 isoform X2 [Papilio machaon]|nr:nuclear factor of activated T-cells 5 isoform X2 [Papilio machaon]XP_014360933.2 nuclear factor of activated T-cells 5 isoform X2 [Papilio machaon]